MEQCIPWVWPRAAMSLHNSFAMEIFASAGGHSHDGVCLRGDDRRRHPGHHRRRLLPEAVAARSPHAVPLQHPVPAGVHGGPCAAPSAKHARRDLCQPA